MVIELWLDDIEPHERANNAWTVTPHTLEIVLWPPLSRTLGGDRPRFDVIKP